MIKSILKYTSNFSLATEKKTPFYVFFFSCSSFSPCPIPQVHCCYSPSNCDFAFNSLYFYSVGCGLVKHSCFVLVEILVLVEVLGVIPFDYSRIYVTLQDVGAMHVSGRGSCFQEYLQPSLRLGENKVLFLAVYKTSSFQ